MFADDTNLFACNKKLDNLISLVESELCEVKNWFEIDKLSLNIKTITLLFTSGQQLYAKCVILIIC